ncbi:23S rRNA (adenine(2030)-N(6))-methyltransferase RlmJ [Phenylobacterium sp. J367]|uniref:23S rRNA (adenine(2030)-N(6))-methyltransferase RlmJ n=1 Tax=Phenylobacterium sp. J367 TaxID=2898435 RepID=UPI0021518897|nr:23S rRNA (adenine(2030)-N(6))-methyltransferase RlmJ [Phenylobacterium sp. J367]MCR5880895.1 23S rRNA (adenine(2030)-N(6))-methyltransferase RlmJ [Phenylobacterium sp. J367]
MNYRHAFHAGNFADLVKHAGLLQLLSRLDDEPRPLTVIDTHAGRGLYDLAGAEARKSGEAEAGIVRLMAAKDAPGAFQPLIGELERLNGGGPARRYPGSPWLIADALRPKDSYLACELRPDEHGALKSLLKDRANVRTLCDDGFQAAMAAAPPSGRVLVLIDPPFERADDYARIVETVAGVRRKNREAEVMIWLPLKDLETFDAFLRDLEDAVAAPLLVAETRMRPLTDPMKMNGCALVFVGAPEGLAPELEAICGWTARALGDSGEARVYTLSS